mmetsp:Transcript_3880/g.8479  ORF Transcript_3880/g.8479 Transcript_3880/m.8479 type:complete len:202 (+) Transcript_3880:644-1249(+)
MVLAFGRLGHRVLERCEVEEMGWAVQLVVKLLGVSELELVLHRRRVSHTHEVVVPYIVVWYHEESKEMVREEHLNLLIVRRQVAVRVGARVAVLPAPFVATGGEFVGGQRDGSRREGAREHDRALAVPRLVLRHDARVRGHVRGGELWQLVGLRVHPSKRLHTLKVGMLRESGRQMDRLVGAPLRHHHEAADLLDLGVVWR